MIYKQLKKAQTFICPNAILLLLFSSLKLVAYNVCKKRGGGGSRNAFFYATLVPYLVECLWPVSANIFEGQMVVVTFLVKRTISFKNLLVAWRLLQSRVKVFFVEKKNM